MLRSIPDLIEYGERRSSKYPDFARRFRIGQPGCSAGEVAILREAVPGIALSYLSVIEKINLDGVSIGYFEFSHGPDRDRGFVERLLHSNDPDVNPRFDVYQRLRVFEVAGWEAEPIAVACTGSRFDVGEMLKFSAYEINEPPVILARDFEQLLLFAASLDQLCEDQRQDSSPNQAHGEFLEYVMGAGAKSETIREWENIASVVLGD